MQVDTRKTEVFAERLVGALNEGALCIMTSIGHRTGLFDAMDRSGPGTSRELADAAGLDERYVREWLGAMVTAGVVEMDPGPGTYALPAEHAAVLTSDAAPDNIAVFTQYIPLMGTVEDEIVRCFREGGGLAYDAYDRFHEVMAQDSWQTIVSALEEHILPLIPGIRKRLEEGIDVLDIGCGSGKALIRMAEIFPRSRFLGRDLSEEAIGVARREAEERGLENVRFEVRDLTDFAESAEQERFDFITAFDAIHDQARPLSVLEGVRRALKADGWFLMQDIRGSSHHHKDVDHPVGTLLYTISCMHCMSVSLAQGGEGLGAMWGEERTREYLERAGFTRVVTRRLDHDFQNNFYVIRP